MTNRARVAIATSERGRRLDQEDLARTLDALSAGGFDAAEGCWDDEAVDWMRFDCVVIRSAWGYADRREEFLSWARTINRLANPLSVLKWNTDKRYLADFTSAGVPTVPTTWIDPGSSSSFALPEVDFVVKPTVGAGGMGAARFGPFDVAHAMEHISALLHEGKSVMVQPYLRAIERDGERGLIFLGGRFSHAIYKPPLLATRGPFVAGSLTVDIIRPMDATDTDLEFASSVLAAVPGGSERLLYVRVDIASADDGSPLLIELEATEPNLYFNYSPGSANRFAEAVRVWFADNQGEPDEES
ncbi:MAG: hypothetical protein WB770_02745 [Acidimicrobiales bacterium]